MEAQASYYLVYIIDQQNIKIFCIKAILHV